MGQRYGELNDRLIEFIGKQRLFFVATAAPDGRVNVSPKGLDTLRVLAPDRIVWLGLSGSGNETAAHLLEIRPHDADVLRLRRHARHPARLWPRPCRSSPRRGLGGTGLCSALAGARQIFDLAIDLVQTSCGFGVPLFDYRGERHQLDRWAADKGEDGIRAYWEEKNLVSLDGKPTHLL